MKNLATAFRPLANDMASSLFLIVLLMLHVDAAMAAIASMAFGAAHIAFMKVTRRPVAPLQWASLLLVLVFGTAGFFLHDIRFLMAKPTIVQLIVAAVMMKRGWMLRYMPPIAAGRGEPMMIAWGYAWAGLMAFLGVTNLVVAVWFAPAWVLYKATVPMGAALTLFALQYLTIRHRVRRQMIAERQLQPA